MNPACERIGRARAGAWLASALALAALASLVGLPATGAWAKLKPWPPSDRPGDYFVHFGEEHINDADGPTLLPKVVRQSARYRPKLVTMSGDKVDDGEPEQLRLWRDVMEIYDEQGVPWFAAVGNHDRKAPPGFPGGVFVQSDFGPYQEFFADRPYPMGDGPAYDDPDLLPRTRDAGDPEGAASHYYVDYGRVRWVFIDNSCWSITLCDGIQNPSGQSPEGEAQLDFLERVGGEATAEGRLVFVVMHMATRDPRDQSYAEPTSVMHTMGKGPLGTADNTLFEQAAVAAGVDGVFLAHIKGQFLYEGEGGIPYYIDGGAGGELYTTGPVGVDHGYWHGYRLLRVRKSGFQTDSVPIFVKDGITIEGPRKLKPGEQATFEAFGRQPVFNDPAKVEALELRDPDPIPPGGEASAWIGDLVRWAGPLAGVLALLALGRLATQPRRRRLAVPAMAAVGGVLVFAGISVAQQSEPTSTPVESLPNPARIWTTSDRHVLKPVASETDDPRRNKRRQTADGTFEAVCPGNVRLRITSGFETESVKVHVSGPAGPKCD